MMFPCPVPSPCPSDPLRPRPASSRPSPPAFPSHPHSDVPARLGNLRTSKNVPVPPFLIHPLLPATRSVQDHLDRGAHHPLPHPLSKDWLFGSRRTSCSSPLLPLALSSLPLSSSPPPSLPVQLLVSSVFLSIHVFLPSLLTFRSSSTCSPFHGSVPIPVVHRCVHSSVHPQSIPSDPPVPLLGHHQGARASRIAAGPLLFSVLLSSSSSLALP